MADWKFRRISYSNSLRKMLNLSLHKAPKQSDIFERFCSKCGKIFKMWVIILGHCLKGLITKVYLIIKFTSSAHIWKHIDHIKYNIPQHFTQWLFSNWINKSYFFKVYFFWVQKQLCSTFYWNITLGDNFLGKDNPPFNFSLSLKTML